MARRDSRRNRGRLLLFVASIVVGIAALVAINSFSANLERDIDREAASLLGADLRLDNNLPAADSITAVFDSLAEDRASMASFVSMVFFPKNQGSRLSNIMAIDGAYPLYGNLSTDPQRAGATYQEGGALIEKTLALQYELTPGDSIRVGNITLPIDGVLNSAPGRSGLVSAAAPAVMIPGRLLDATGLIQPGSRVRYEYFYRFAPGTAVDALAEQQDEFLDEAGWDTETVSERKRSLGRAFGTMSSFLNLVGFIALLLGCIGVASAVHIYIKQKISTIAVLRTLGASGKQAFGVYFVQVVVLGLLGGLLGALLGSLLQLALPLVLSDFLPVENVSAEVSLPAVIGGIGTGLAITVLFALLPLLEIRRVSPLRAIRASYEADTARPDPLRWLVYLLIFGFVLAFSWWQTGGGAEAIGFPVAVVLIFLLLAGVARLLMWAVRKFFPRKWSFTWRQAIANLYRPNNQTLVLIVTIGLGTALISTLFLTQNLLLGQVEFTGRGEQPNTILFDIQPPQRDAVAELARSYELPLLQQVPIVTMRLETINGQDKVQYQADTTRRVRDWVFDREYRVTYRDSLIDSEELVQGAFQAIAPPSGYPEVSLSEGLFQDMRVELGDTLVFNVQGVRIPATVGSTREVDFARMQTNFLVLFPAGVLEPAPQFNVLITRTEDETQSAAFQQALVRDFPNVSIIDLTTVLKTVGEILDKVSFVIQFMALFSILTGLLVLISSVILSKYQRIRESVLLRTLGASRRQILSINALEYLLLGGLAVLTGVGLSYLSAWVLARFVFDIPFEPDLWPALWTFVIITGLTVLIGWSNALGVVREPPLQVLRGRGV